MNGSSLANETWHNANPFSVTEKIGFTVAYLILLLVAVVGNCFVIHVARKKLAAGRGPFSMMVIHMATSDILYAVTTVALSVKFIFVRYLWFPSAFGTFLCKLSRVALIISLSSSIFSLTAMAVDRYLAIVPNVKRSMTSKSVVKVILGIVLMSVALTWFPLIRMNTVSHTYQAKELAFCGPYYLDIDKDVAEKLKKAGHISFLVLLYALPVIVMSFLYFGIVRFLWLREIPGIRTERNERQRRNHTKKVTCMLITMTTTFAFTWFPAHVAHFYVSSDTVWPLPFSYLLLTWFGNTNCATNPCFYFIFCKEYRDELWRVLGWFFSKNIENRVENVNLN